MVLLRSSVFRVRIHDHDVDVGPSSFLQSVIDAADRAVDRVRAQERAWTVARVMENVAFDKALTALPPYMCALMQNLKPDEQNEFTEKIEKLRTGKQSDQVKVLTLGLLAMNQMGEGVLRAAVDSLAVEIRRAAERTSNAAVEAADAAKVAEERAAAAVTAAAMTAAAVPPEVPAEVKHAAAEATSAAVEAADAARAASDRTEVTAETALDTEAAVAASEGRATEHQRRATAGAGAESSDAVAPVPQTHLNGGPNRT